MNKKTLAIASLILIVATVSVSFAVVTWSGVFSEASILPSVAAESSTFDNEVGDATVFHLGDRLASVNNHRYYWHGIIDGTTGVIGDYCDGSSNMFFQLSRGSDFWVLQYHFSVVAYDSRTGRIALNLIE